MLYIASTCSFKTVSILDLFLCSKTENAFSLLNCNTFASVHTLMFGANMLCLARSPANDRRACFSLFSFPLSSLSFFWQTPDTERNCQFEQFQRPTNSIKQQWTKQNRGKMISILERSSGRFEVHTHEAHEDKQINGERGQVVFIISQSAIKRKKENGHWQLASAVIGETKPSITAFNHRRRCRHFTWLPSAGQSITDRRGIPSLPQLFQLKMLTNHIINQRVALVIAGIHSQLPGHRALAAPPPVAALLSTSSASPSSWNRWAVPIEMWPPHTSQKMRSPRWKSWQRRRRTRSSPRWQP